MKDYDVYLFDWDGTLASSHDGWLEFYKKELRKYGKELTDHEIVETIFGRAQAGCRDLGLSEDEVQEVEGATILYAKEQMASSPLYPGAQEVLKLLAAKGKKLALVTASFREVVDIAVAHHELLELFEVTVTGDEVKAQKPDPDGILTVLKRLGVAAEKAIMIGDSPKDLLAGKNAGTDTLLFYPPEHEAQHPPEKLQACNPTYTVRSWREMLDTLQ